MKLKLFIILVISVISLMHFQIFAEEANFISKFEVFMGIKIEKFSIPFAGDTFVTSEPIQLLIKYDEKKEVFKAHVNKEDLQNVSGLYMASVLSFMGFKINKSEEIYFKQTENKFTLVITKALKNPENEDRYIAECIIIDNFQKYISITGNKKINDSYLEKFTKLCQSI